MNEEADPLDRSRTLRERIRSVRQRYDKLHKLERGRTAAIRRSRSAAEVALEGVFWRIGGDFARSEPQLAHLLAHVVHLFPLAPHRRRDDFSFGRYLNRQLGDSDGAALRVRRLLASRDRDELDHRMRGLLKLASGDKTPVDWGALGVDVLWFFAESDNVRRRWAQDFYAPMARTPRPEASAPTSSTTS